MVLTAFFRAFYAEQNQVKILKLQVVCLFSLASCISKHFIMHCSFYHQQSSDCFSRQDLAMNNQVMYLLQPACSEVTYNLAAAIFSSLHQAVSYGSFQDFFTFHQVNHIWV
jgi:hypothetical protein